MLNDLMILYFTFLKIGSFAFGGGYAVLPLIQKYVVDDMKWLTINDLSDLIAISQITPGTIGINSATFIGVKTVGIVGGIVATVAEVTPCCLLMLFLGRILFSGKRLKAMDYILNGLKPAIVGLILIAAINLFTSAIFTKTGISIIGVVGFFVGFYCFYYRKFSTIKTVGIAAFVGFIMHIMMNIV